MQVSSSGMSRLVDVYVYRLEQNEIKILLLKRARDVMYAGQWRMIGGKVNDEEKAYEAARRELYEETGLTAKKFWTIPSINQFYDHKTDCVYQIPAFGVEVEENAVIELNHEHIDSRWLSGEEISHHVSWPEQRRLIQLLISIVTDNEILEEWIINTQD